MKKKKFNAELNQMRDELKNGDKVMTDAGVVGEVVDSYVEEEYKYLKLQNQLLQDYYILQYTYNGNTMTDCIVYDEFGK